MSSAKTSLPQPDQRRSQDAAVPVPRAPVVGLSSSKIQSWHLERLAFVYVRQSSPQQVVEHRESRLRQYALVDYAIALGWPADRVQVIDEDQGQSGRDAENRAGFQRLLAEVAIDHVGIVLGLEMSRLARSDKDWHHLLEVCGIFGTLVADQDGVYNAADPNDRLLLGLKGMLSSVELQTMRNRLEKGKLSKAARGELFLDVPVGYVKTPAGEMVRDPDEQARAVVALIFDKFEELGSVYAVYRYRQMRDYDRLAQRLRELRKAGHTAGQMADQLNQEGFHPTGRRKTFCAMTVRQLLSRWQLSGERHETVELGPDEWWLSDLARKLKVSPATVRRWIDRRWMHCRRSPQHGYHLLWADADELERLGRLRDHGRTYPKIPSPPALTTPKRRPSDKAKSSANGASPSRGSKKH
jgi:DNA invertase Pin-like site-specific DNA recombinase